MLSRKENKLPTILLYAREVCSDGVKRDKVTFKRTGGDDQSPDAIYEICLAVLSATLRAIREGARTFGYTGPYKVQAG